MINKRASLTPETIHIITHKGTESPHTGQYNTHDKSGTYLCRQCGLALFRSTDKFLSSCGWPSFDDEIANTVLRLPDDDGVRTEIVCRRCHAHLGHIFFNEGLTGKNARYCVNSLSLDFVTDNKVIDTQEVLFAGGCFWGVEYYLKRLKGVLYVESGYTGGHVNNPSYEQVCAHMTGHYEAVRVLFDPQVVSLETLIKHFLEIHDPCQDDGQGPDIGEQYKSAIFYYNEAQAQIAKNLIMLLVERGLNVVTQLIPATVFWPAEDYHQDYYHKTGKQPYCHRPVKRFE